MHGRFGAILGSHAAIYYTVRRALADCCMYFVQYTGVNRTYFSEEFLNNELDSIVKEYSHLWDRLWEVGMPFLDRRPR